MADQDFNINISTSVQLAALRELEANLEKNIAKARALGDAGTEGTKKMEAQLASVRTQLGGFSFGQKLGAELTEVAGKIPGVGTALNILNGSMLTVAGTAAGVAASLKFAKDALNEYAEGEEKMATLDAALAAQGQLTEDYRLKLQDLAGEMQKTLGIADDKWFPVFERLTKFGADSSNIEKYTEAVVNLAGVIGGDIDTAAGMFSRAMQGNFDLFSRYGIRVDDAGTKTERLNMLMEQLAGRGAGVLEARSHSLNGQWERMGNATADLYEAFGRMIARTGVVQGSLNSSANALQSFADLIGGPIDKIDGLVNKVGELEGAGAVAERFQASVSAAMAKIVRDTDEATESLKRQLGQLDRAQKQADEMANANMALELAQAGDAQDPASVQKRAEIRKRYADQEFDRNQATTQAKITANKQAIDQSSGGLADVDKNVALQRDRVERARAIDEQERAAKLTLGQNQEEIRKAREEVQLAAQNIETQKAWLGTETQADRDRAALAQTSLKAAVDREYLTNRDKLQPVRDARASAGVGTGEQEAAKLKEMEEAQKKLSDEVVKENTERNETIKQLMQELRLAQEIKSITDKTTAVTDKKDLTAAQKKAAEDAAKQTAAKLENDAVEAERNGDPAKAAALRNQAAKAKLPATATPEETRAVDLEIEGRLRDLRKDQSEKATEWLGDNNLKLPMQPRRFGDFAGEAEKRNAPLAQTQARFNAAKDKALEDGSISAAEAKELMAMLDQAVSLLEQQGAQVSEYGSQIDALKQRLATIESVDKNGGRR